MKGVVNAFNKVVEEAAAAAESLEEWVQRLVGAADSRWRARLSNGKWRDGRKPRLLPMQLNQTS